MPVIIEDPALPPPDGGGGGGNDGGRPPKPDPDTLPEGYDHWEYDPDIGVWVPVKKGGNDGGGGGGGKSSTSSGGGGSSGGSSGGGGGGGGPDYKSQQEARLAGIFFELWGEAPSPNYISAAANHGLTTWEFAEQEMSKPAWWKTPAAKKRAEPYARIIQLVKAVMG